jgi:hypothetical protein
MNLLDAQEEARARADRLTSDDGPMQSVPSSASPRTTPTPLGQLDRSQLMMRAQSEGFYYTPDASAYPNRYYLELYLDYRSNSTDPMDAVSLQHIHSITKHDPVALVRGRSLSGYVYQENEGFAQAVFTLAGRSGDSPVDHARFQKMRNFLQVYAREMRTHKNAITRGNDVQLVLHFPFEAESYLCDVTTFDYRRSAASSTNSFEFTLTLVTNGRTERKWALPATANALALLARSEDSSHTANARHPCLRNFERERRLRLPDPGEPAQVIEKIMLQVIDSPSPGCPEVVAGTASLASFSLWANAYTYATYPKRLNAYMYTTLYASDLVGSGLTYSGSRFGRCTSPPTSLRAFEPWLSSFQLRFALHRTSMVPTPPPRSVSPSLPFVCRQDAVDAHSIAEETLGDRTQADVIITFNRMLDAYTYSDGTPLAPGSVVYIPQQQGALTVDGDPFGTDLLIRDGDLVAVGESDIATIGGYACYSQNIQHRLTTVRGENKVYPSYGLRPYVGQSDASDIPADLRANVRGQLMADHRTEQILAITLVERGDKVDVSVHVKPVSSQPASIQFTYNLVG